MPRDIKRQKLKQHEHYLANIDKFRARDKENKRQRQQWFQELKSTMSCEQCGENHPACIDFHHKDPTIKLETVGYMASKGRSKKKILEEISKCAILCANCHRKLHYNTDKHIRQYALNKGTLRDSQNSSRQETSVFSEH